MFIDPLDTSPCSAFRVDKAREEIERHLIHQGDIGQQIVALDQENPHYGLALFSGSDINPKPFGHPIEISWKRQNVYIFDARPFTRLTREGVPAVHNVTEYALHKTRTLLQSVWASEERYLMNNLGDLPSVLYVAWITENLSKRFAVPGDSYNRLRQIVRWYWWCITHAEDEFDEDTALRLQASLTSQTVYSEGIADLINEIGYIKDVYGLCKAIEEHSGSVRLKGLNPFILYQVTGGVWMGVNARDLLACAIEHVPTFIAIAYYAINGRAMKQTGLSRMAQLYNRHGSGDKFVQAVTELLNYHE